MAKLKYEFLDHYTPGPWTPPERRESIRRTSTLAEQARLPGSLPLSNWVVRQPPEPAVPHALGLWASNAKRKLPAFARTSFPAWFRRHRPLATVILGPRHAASGHEQEVVLFNDTFMNYNYPSRWAVAAVEVLEKAGFNVESWPTRGVAGGR